MKTHKKLSTPSQLSMECLEPRLLLSTSSYEAYAWSVINLMRADPPKFAKQLEGLYNNTISGAPHGVAANDPVWTDLRNQINNAPYKQHFWDALALLRIQPPLGPLGWEDDLEIISGEHNAWMQQWCYAHSDYEGDDNFPTPVASMPGFSQNTNIAGNYDVVNPEILGEWSTGSWGENIGYSTGNSLSATRNAFGTGTRDHRQRQAYADIIGFIIEVNSNSLGHLRNLLSRDRADGGFDLLGKNKDIGRKNAIGLDYNYFDAGLSNGTTNLVATHTLSTHRQYDGEGGYIAGLAYTDRNGNGFYDAGEGAHVSWAIDSPGGYTIITETTYANHGIISDFQVFNGVHTLTAMVGDRVIGRREVNIQDNNVWVEFRISPGFGLVDDDQLLVVPDRYDAAGGNNTLQTASFLGVIHPGDAWNGASDVFSLLGTSASPDLDYFRFNIADRPADADILIGYDDDTPGVLEGVLVMRVELQNGEWTPLEAYAFELYPEGDVRVTETLPPGTYIIGLQGWGGVVYSLTADIETVPLPDDAYEPNNSPAAAASLPAGQWLSNVAGYGIQKDDDFFAIQVPTGFENVIIDLAYTYFDGDVNAQLYDVAGNVVASVYGVEDNESINVVVPAGLYRVCVFGDNHGNQYDLQWSTYAPPTRALGDFDLDDDADGFDFLLWQRTLGSNESLSADANGDGTVGADDLTAWIAGFGQPLAAPDQAAPALIMATRSNGPTPDVHAAAMQIDDHPALRMAAPLAAFDRPGVSPPRRLELRAHVQHYPLTTAHRPGAPPLVSAVAISNAELWTAADNVHDGLREPALDAAMARLYSEAADSQGGSPRIANLL